MSRNKELQQELTNLDKLIQNMNKVKSQIDKLNSYCKQLCIKRESLKNNQISGQIQSLKELPSIEQISTQRSETNISCSQSIDTEISAVQLSIDKFSKYYTSLCEQEYLIRNKIQVSQSQKQELNSDKMLTESTEEIQCSAFQIVYNQWPEQLTCNSAREPQIPRKKNRHYSIFQLLSDGQQNSQLTTSQKLIQSKSMAQLAANNFQFQNGMNNNCTISGNNKSSSFCCNTNNSSSNNNKSSCCNNERIVSEFMNNLNNSNGNSTQNSVQNSLVVLNSEETLKNKDQQIRKLKQEIEQQDYRQKQLIQEIKEQCQTDIAKGQQLLRMEWQQMIQSNNKEQNEKELQLKNKEQQFRKDLEEFNQQIRSVVESQIKPLQEQYSELLEKEEQLNRKTSKSSEQIYEQEILKLKLLANSYKAEIEVLKKWQCGNLQTSLERCSPRSLTSSQTFSGGFFAQQFDQVKRKLLQEEEKSANQKLEIEGLKLLLQLKINILKQENKESLQTSSQDILQQENEKLEQKVVDLQNQIKKFQILFSHIQNFNTSNNRNCSSDSYFTNDGNNKNFSNMCQLTQSQFQNELHSLQEQLAEWESQNYGEIEARFSKLRSQIEQYKRENLQLKFLLQSQIVDEESITVQNISKISAALTLKTAECDMWKQRCLEEIERKEKYIPVTFQTFNDGQISKRISSIEQYNPISNNNSYNCTSDSNSSSQMQQLQNEIVRLKVMVEEKAQENEILKSYAEQFEGSFKEQQQLFELQLKNNAVKNQTIQIEYERALSDLKSKAQKSDELNVMIQRLDLLVKEKTTQNAELARKYQSLLTVLKERQVEEIRNNALEQKYEKQVQEIEQLKTMLVLKSRAIEQLETRQNQGIDQIQREKNLLEQELLKMKSHLDLVVQENNELKNRARQIECWYNNYVGIENINSNRSMCANSIQQKNDKQRFVLKEIQNIPSRLLHQQCQN